MRLLSASARHKLRGWVVRYLPAEIAGTITALTAFGATYAGSDSLALAAVAGTIGENVGYYGVASGREVWHYWRAHHEHRQARRLWLTGLHSLRGLIVEFGAAEVIDSFLVRPGLFYLLPLIFSSHKAWALLAAKLLADLIFYSFAALGYELRKKLFRHEIAAASPEPDITTETEE